MLGEGAYGEVYAMFHRSLGWVTDCGRCLSVPEVFLTLQFRDSDYEVYPLASARLAGNVSISARLCSYMIGIAFFFYRSLSFGIVQNVCPALKLMVLLKKEHFVGVGPHWSTCFLFQNVFPTRFLQAFWSFIQQQQHPISFRSERFSSGGQV